MGYYEREQVWPGCITQSPPPAALRHPLTIFAAALGPARPTRPTSPPPVTARTLPTPLPALPRRTCASRPPGDWRGLTPEPIFSDSRGR